MFVCCSSLFATHFLTFVFHSFISFVDFIPILCAKLLLAHTLTDTQAANQASDVADMRSCALTLLSFQGSAIIKRYVFATIQARAARGVEIT